MLRVARTLTGDPTESEDLVQDSLVRAYKAIDRFDGAHPRAWLLTIVRNTNVNRHRKQRPSLLDDPDDQDRLNVDTAPGPDAYIDDLSFDVTVDAALATLTDDARAVIDAVDLMGLTYAQAAERLGIPEGTVMSRLHRARRKIRDELRAQGIDGRSGRCED